MAPTAAAGGRLGRIVVVNGGGELADVFAGVIEVEDLNGSGEGEAAVFPNPCGTVTDIDDLFGPVQTAASVRVA